jgi:hypothetical protein
MSFIQIIEFESDRIDELQALMQQGPPEGTPAGMMRVTHDRDNPLRYMVIIEFPSYEAAMENSNKPETDAMAKEMAALCLAPPRFHNLDVIMSQG